MSSGDKHSAFVVGPMGDKDVTEIAGVEEDLGDRLKAKGFQKVMYFSV